MFGVLCIVTSPDTWLVEVVTGLMQLGSCGRVGSVVGVQPGGGTAARGAPRVLNSTPAEAVVSLEITVLLMNFTASASCIDTPPPSHPATLLAMMLLVTVTLFHPGLREAWGPLVIGFGPFGNATTSWPLTICSRRPPPVPLSALLPMIRLASMTRLRPVPSGSPGGQSWSVVEPHSIVVPSGSVSNRSGEAPRTARPPPWVGIVGLAVWLNRIQLFEMVPSLMKPECATPPASPVLRLPQIQLLFSR